VEEDDVAAVAVVEVIARGGRGGRRVTTAGEGGLAEVDSELLTPETNGTEVRCCFSDIQIDGDVCGSRCSRRDMHAGNAESILQRTGGTSHQYSAGAEAS
jgi:hypothetical protein